MTQSTPKSNQIVVLTKEESIAVKSKQEVLLLLQHLAESQETTVKLILSRLYDLGVFNFIDKRVSSPVLKKAIRRLSKLPKPAFKVIGFYWFKRNCPQLITDWLVAQVAFEAAVNNPETVIDVAPDNLKISEIEETKILKLRSRVRLLTTLLSIVIAVSGISFVWLFYNFKNKSDSLQISEPTAICAEQ